MGIIFNEVWWFMNFKLDFQDTQTYLDYLFLAI